MARYETLFTPLNVGSVQIKNRVVRTAHGTGLVGEDLIAYHEARAKGGVALSFLQATGVHPTARTGLPIFEDSVIPFLASLADRMRPHGMRVFISSTTRGRPIRSVPVRCTGQRAPSRIP